MNNRSSRKVAGRVKVAVIALPFTLLGAVAHSQDVSEQSDSQWGSGKNLYDKVCGYCHEPEVGVGTVLAGRALPEVYLRGIVRSGLNAMPAFPASFVDDESIAQLAEYLATLPAPAEPAAPTAPAAPPAPTAPAAPPSPAAPPAEP